MVLIYRFASSSGELEAYSGTAGIRDIKNYYLATMPEFGWKLVGEYEEEVLKRGEPPSEELLNLLTPSLEFFMEIPQDELQAIMDVSENVTSGLDILF